ncbi:MAG: toxin [Gallionellaceae bacterium]|nr:MAG: toxin [Gallionellaceae bacterium]
MISLTFSKVCQYAKAVLILSSMLFTPIANADGSDECYHYLEAKEYKRGGLRVIYYWWMSGKQFWLYTVYNKDEMDDLTTAQRKLLKDLLKQELDARRIK